MIQSWQIGVLGVLLVGIALVLMAFGLRRRPPSVPLTGSGILIAISGLALLYAWAFPPGPPAWQGYLLLGGGSVVDLGILVWAFADSIFAPVKGRLRPHLVDRRCELKLAAGLAIVAGEATALFVMHPAFSVSVLALAGLWILWWLPPSRRRMTGETNIIVDRSPAEVFDYVGNFENHLQYVPLLTEVIRTSPGPIGVGTTFRLRTSNFEWEEQFIEFSRPASFSTHALAGERNRATTRFESIDARTRVSFSYEREMGLPRALTGDGFYLEGLRPKLIDLRKGWFKTLKELLEANRPS
jgi:hypothetical protein